eukprot:2267134-Amphidinium_carterae.1
MALPIIRGRQIQEHTDDVLCDLSFGDTLHVSQNESDPLPGLRAGRGAHQKNDKVDYEVNYMKSKRTITSLSVVLFDMVAEFAIEFASIVVTRASQFLYYIAWLCGFCVGTLRAYMEWAAGIDSDIDSDDV